MAFVILSRRNLTRSKTRTVSLAFFGSLMGLVLLVTLALGLFLGSKMSRWAAFPDLAPVSARQAQQVSQTSPDPSPALVEHIGELSARMVQLELEASGLAERLDVVKKFEQRMRMDRPVPLGPAAKTPPASGGPLFEPLPSVVGADRDTPKQTSGSALTDIAHHIEQISRLLTRLDRRIVEVSLAYMSFPGRLPVLHGIKTSGFGNRKDPFNTRLAFHSGVDFAAPVGTPVRASAGGKVVFSGTLGSYGKVVEIDHGAGLVTRYAHLSKIVVKKHQIVEPEQLIARMGSTGRSTGSHLHFEILKDGHFVDPALYLKRF